jgi:deazaflavin-dependent oxidoreductase (nitroreductase family)
MQDSQPDQHDVDPGEPNQPASLRDRVERLYRIAERRVINPAMRWLLQKGVAPRAFALLETTGRRTGKPRLTPVGNGLEDHVFWLVAMNGRRADYVQNLLATPRVRVKIGRRWRTGSATLLPGDDAYRRRQILDRANGIVGRLDGLIFRAAATDVCTIRIDLTDA